MTDLKLNRFYVTLVLFVAVTSSVSALSASSAIVMEQGSGRVLSEHNADEVRSIASVTKLMTALVVVQQVDDLSSVVTVGAESCNIEGSSLYLRAGEKISVEDLLYGLLLRSGNDAAHALAVYVAGSVNAFAELMNEQAQELGMNNSHFMNPNGLEQEGHYSTARDMALLGCACLDNQTLAKICATQSITVGGRVIQNHNKLLWQYEGCVGMKTGFTEAAGRTLVSAATRNNLTLVAVTLNAPDDWRDHTNLLDDGFSQISLQACFLKDEVMTRIPVSGGLIPFVSVCASEDWWYPMRAGERLTTEVLLCQDEVTAPVRVGDNAGVIRCYCDGALVDEIPLYYRTSVANLLVTPETLWQKMGHFIGR